MGGNSKLLRGVAWAIAIELVVAALVLGIVWWVR
jgi:hypothetical protein